jgi:hypothetical protein
MRLFETLWNIVALILIVEGTINSEHHPILQDDNVGVKLKIESN